MDLKEFEKSINSEINRHPWELARLNMLTFFINSAKKKKTILDIGSGDAFLASAIAKKWPASKVVGVDSNYHPDLLEKLKKDKPTNLFLYPDLLSYSNSLTDKADIIIMMDVLEHVKIPGEMLHQVLQLTDQSLSPLIIITAPAFQMLFSTHDEKLGHYKRYRRKELIKILDDHSIFVTRSGYCFASLLIPRLFQVIVEKLTKKEFIWAESINMWKGGKLITFFLKSIFWIEFKISWYLSRIGIYIPGLTCYCICQNSPLSSPATTKERD